MILIAIGANLPSERFGPPLAACEAAIRALGNTPGVRVRARSAWYESAPVPASDQPWYVNGAVSVETALAPHALLTVLQGIEVDFGRVRGKRNAPRVIDLDLIDYQAQVLDGPGLELPHPRLSERAFVLLPIADLTPDWRHPVSGVRVQDLIEALPPGQEIRKLG